MPAVRESACLALNFESFIRWTDSAWHVGWLGRVALRDGVGQQLTLAGSLAAGLA